MKTTRQIFLFLLPLFLIAVSPRFGVTATLPPEETYDAGGGGAIQGGRNGGKGCWRGFELSEM